MIFSESTSKIFSCGKQLDLYPVWSVYCNMGGGGGGGLFQYHVRLIIILHIWFHKSGKCEIIIYSFVSWDQDSARSYNKMCYQILSISQQFFRWWLGAEQMTSHWPLTEQISTKMLATIWCHWSSMSLQIQWPNIAMGNKISCTGLLNWQHEKEQSSLCCFCPVKPISKGGQHEFDCLVACML